MKKHNLGIHTAIASAMLVMVGSASAGVANGIPVNMATQSIISNTTTVAGGNVTYSTQSPVAIGTVWVYVKLSGGATFAQAAGGAIDATQLVRANQGAATVVVSPGVVSTDRTYAVFPVAISVAAMPVNATFTFTSANTTPATGQVTTAGFLATPAATLSAALSIGSTNSATTVQADVDTAASGNLIVSRSGVASTVLASSAASFTATAAAGGMVGAQIEVGKQINVVTGTGTALTAGTTSNTGASTSLINFGGYNFRDVAGTVANDGATAFNIGTNYNAAYSAVLTGNFGAAIGTGGAVTLRAAFDCTGGPLSTAVVTGGTTATFTAIPTLATAVPVFVCMQVNTTNTVSIPVTQPSLVVTLAGTSAATSNVTTAATSLYNLINNGATVDVRSYVPAAAVGYTSYIRIINTGSVAAPVSASVINQTTGVVGTSAVIIPSLAAGASTTLTSSQLETAIGAIAATDRPRIRITAPGVLSVQSYMLNPGGSFTILHGAD